MTTKSEFAFSSIPIPEREEKPRKKGLTMMIDWGIPLGLQKDCLEGQGLYVDEAKIAGSIHRVMPADYLKKKIAAYQAEDIFTFPGGLFTELAIAQGTGLPALFNRWETTPVPPKASRQVVNLRSAICVQIHSTSFALLP